MPKKRPEGRPPTFKTPEALENKIRLYFNSEAYAKEEVINKNGKMVKRRKFSPTISGLALYCGFADRYSFYDYEKKPEFTYTIKKARAQMCKYYERLIAGANCTGAIFMLKNFGYHDKTEIEHSGKIALTKEERNARVSRIQNYLTVSTN